jgi:cytochrome P450
MSEALDRKNDPNAIVQGPDGPAIPGVDFPIPTGQLDADPWSWPLEKIDPSDSLLFQHDQIWGWFERLRKEDPVHYTAESFFGPYWSVTTFDEIVQVEKDPETYSSAGSITIGNPQPEFPISPGFIAMDGERHIKHRNTVAPVVAPRNLKRMEPLIRERVISILDSLPVGESFDWVDRVSIELTTAMLATMFDFPFEERRKLTHWSDIATTAPDQTGATGVTREERKNILMECLSEFQALLDARRGKGTGLDFVSMIANGADMQDLKPLEYLGTLILLIVGGNDTTRNSISGGVLALNENPAEYDKLRANPGIIPNMVSEIIRWQTPLAHMRRTATRDAELAGKTIRAGDKVVMWYVSANRDEQVIPRANEFLIDRKNARTHLSFGWGKHFCVGSRMAEMQLRILWEEIMQRYRMVEVAGEPVRVRSNFVKGFRELPVRLHPL